MKPFCQRTASASVALAVLLGGCAQAQDTPNASPPNANAPDASVPPQPQPEAPVAAAPVTPAPFAATVWRAGQPGTLHIAGPLAGYQGALQVLDSAGKIVWRGLAVRGARSVPIPVSKPGFYTLKASGVTLNFAVVPAPKPRAQQVAGRMLVGLNTHFAQRDAPDEAYRMLQAIGIDAVRDEMGWGPIEKVKGTFTFPPRHLDYNAKLKAHNIPLHWSASYGNPIYPTAGGRHPAAAAAEPYARYVVEVLKKFGGNIIAVEILNEPNKLPPVVDYLPVLRATYQAVKREGFKQPIVAVGGAGPAGGGMAPGYARAVFNAAKQESAGVGPRNVFADGFSQHPYMTPFTPDTGYATPDAPANLDTALTRAGNVVRDYGLSGSWITELGWPAIPPGEVPTPEQWEDNRSAKAMVSEPKQAAFTARTLLGASRFAHLKGIYLYDFQDDGPIALRREHRFGLVRQDLQPKMGFQAFAIAADFLRDKSFVRRLGSDASPLTANLYRDRAGQLWLAAWTMEVPLSDVLGVIARKKAEPDAKLPTRHMENENHARFRVRGVASLSGHDWQGQPVQGAQLSATSLPVYLKVGRNEATVALETLKVEKVKTGSQRGSR